jgi:hypothetical protein
MEPAEAEPRHAALRGVVGAMAMTGVRRVTTGLGLVELPPPEEVATHGAARLFERLPRGRRDAAVELMHWGTGAAAGALYGTLPGELRRSRAFGAAYGVAIMLVFDAAVAPLLGRAGRRRRLGERAWIAVDHALYGVVLASAKR